MRVGGIEVPAVQDTIRFGLATKSDTGILGAPRRRKERARRVDQDAPLWREGDPLY